MNSLPIIQDVTAEEVVQTFLSGRSEDTIRAYRKDLGYYADFVASEAISALNSLFSEGNGLANLRIERYKSFMIEQELSPATINRRLSAIRSIVKLARKLCYITWTLEVSNVKSESYRDTRGPDLSEVKRLMAASTNQRDSAILMLLFVLALRRGEVARLNLEDFDGEILWIQGKGKFEKEPLTLPGSIIESLNAWIKERGNYPGSLFTNFDRAGKGERLTGHSINRIVKAIGKRAGVKVSAHGLRHSSITYALDQTGGDVRSVQQFSRHAKVETVLKYDDNRCDLRGELARKISEGLFE